MEFREPPKPKGRVEDLGEDARRIVSLVCQRYWREVSRNVLPSEHAARCKELGIEGVPLPQGEQALEASEELINKGYLKLSYDGDDIGLLVWDGQEYKQV